MCGIAGVFGANRDCLDTMLGVMRTRGPDAMRAELFRDLGLAIGHVRLSILDLDPRSHQPFRSPCGRFWLTFNGEIYNYRQLRTQLEQQGVAFQTSSDTEVLLHWLIKRGRAGLYDLEGMFAFGLLDAHQRTLLLARDHIGEKPLYYAQAKPQGEPSFAFASDIKALLAAPWINTSLCEHGLTDYLRFLYTPHPHTLYQGIKELPPGSWLQWELGSPVGSPQSFYRLEDELEAVRDMPYSQAVQEFRAAFVESVKGRLQSDVPVGLFLSGGLDSNAILSAAHQLDSAEQLTAYTVAYDRQGSVDGDESQLASHSARHFGIEHHITSFPEKMPLQETAERTLQLFGQPYGNATALVADALSHEASQRSRVCLIGDGGDELLNGYPRHRVLPWAARLNSVAGPFGGAIDRIAKMIPSRGPWEIQADRLKRLTQTFRMPISESFLRWTTYLNQTQIESATGLRCRSGFYEGLAQTFQRHEHNPLLAASLVDLQSFIPCKLMHCSDRAGMAHSLELRCPFLAPPLIRLALAFPPTVKVRGRQVKPLLRDAFADELPPLIKRQPKRPFNPPMRRYLRSHWNELEDVLLGGQTSIGAVVERDFLEAKLGEFHRCERDHSTLLWGLFVLDRWLASQHSEIRQTNRNAA